MLYNVNGCCCCFFFHIHFALVLFVKPEVSCFRSCFHCTHFFRLFLLFFPFYLLNRIWFIVCVLVFLSYTKQNQIKRKNERARNKKEKRKQHTPTQKEDHKLRLFSCNVNLVKMPAFFSLFITC